MVVKTQVAVLMILYTLMWIQWETQISDSVLQMLIEAVKQTIVLLQISKVCW